MNKKISSSKKIKIICFLVLFVIILSGSSFFIFSNQLENLKKENVELMKSIEFDQLYTYMECLYKEADNNAKEVAQRITKELNNSDLDSIKTDLDEDGYSEKLYGILNENTEGVYLNNIDNRRNGIIVATLEGIIEDYYILRAHDDNLTTHPYDNYYADAYNKTLTNNAVKSIKTHSTNGLLVMESFKLSGTPENHKLISLATYDTLKEVYMNEGLEGFKNYQFQSVEYITDTGDIFGQKDVIGGNIHKTYKIIIIQEFNLYDHVSKFYPEMFNDSKNHELIISYDWFNVIIILIALIFLVCVTIAVILAMNIYNTYINGLKYNNKA